MFCLQESMFGLSLCGFGWHILFAYITHLLLFFLFRIYHKTAQVYTEKEIIALAAKEGIAQNSIQDVHNSLIDDGLVEKEKISGSNYHWSFPGKKDRQAQVKHEQTLKAIEAMKLKLAESQAQLADAKRGREDDSENDRPAKLARLAELKAQKEKLLAELEVLKENDPAALADLEKELKFVTAAATRWTDNIFECKDWLTKKKGVDKSQANKLLQITENFDCKLFHLFYYAAFYLEESSCLFLTMSSSCFLLCHCSLFSDPPGTN